MESIKSRPLPGVPFEYYFYVELVGEPGGQEGEALLEALGRICHTVRVLGCIPNERTSGTEFTMNLGARSYDIILKRGALENLGLLARLNRRVAIVTDSGVPAAYARRVAASAGTAAL